MGCFFQGLNGTGHDEPVMQVSQLSFTAVGSFTMLSQLLPSEEDKRLHRTL